jgi:protein required for attachment to host cells
MMTLTRQEIEVLLDSPKQRHYVVSAYADMTVQDGFSRHVETHLRNQAKAAQAALAKADARKSLEVNIEVIRQAIASADHAAKGLAVFSSVDQGLRHVVPLGFPVENRLIIDEEPFILPLLECWYAEPSYLIVLVDSDEAHLFEAHHGLPEPVRDLQREDAHEQIQRDKPRFTYKKRFAKTDHERLHGIEQDKFLHEVAAAVVEHARGGPFTGLILLGHASITQPLRRLLPRELEAMVAGEAAHAMTARPEDLADDVSRLIEDDRVGREARSLSELQERWNQKHLVANGPTDVLDALQQGRATEIFLGRRRDLPGAICRDCHYRLGAATGVCPYCQGMCRPVNASQEILRMAMRHRVPVRLFRSNGSKDDPLSPAGGVSAFVRAEPNWAPHGMTNGTA